VSEPDTSHGDLHPENLKIYGYCVAVKDGERNTWNIQQDDEHENLPAHYPFMGEAIGRCVHLTQAGVDARVLALIALPIDTAEEFQKRKRNDE
jgi:hypothetical protein